MQLINTSTQEIVDEQTFRSSHKTISFPKVLQGSVVSSFGYSILQDGTVPDFDHLTQTVVMDAPTETDGVWAKTFVVVNKPQQEAEQSIRNERNRLLRDTDYLALSDNTMSVEMIAYRKALRDLTSQEGFPYNVVWPDKP